MASVSAKVGNGLLGVWDVDEPMQVISGPIGMPHVHYEAPPRDCGEFLEWFNQTPPYTAAPDAQYGLTWAALAHFRFVTIHPFEDGNGRLARAITDMALAQAEMNGTRLNSLSARIQLVREEYYQILEHTQRGITRHHWLDGLVFAADTGGLRTGRTDCR